MVQEDFRDFEPGQDSRKKLREFAAAEMAGTPETRARTVSVKIPREMRLGKRLLLRDSLVDGGIEVEGCWIFVIPRVAELVLKRLLVRLRHKLPRLGDGQ